MPEQIPPPDEDQGRKVTVCSECLQASCWQGAFMCQASREAATVDLPVWALDILDQENPEWWTK